MKTLRFASRWGVVFGAVAVAAACSEPERSFSQGDGDSSAGDAASDDEGSRDASPAQDAAPDERPLNDAGDDSGGSPGPLDGGDDPEEPRPGMDAGSADGGAMMYSCTLDKDCDDNNVCNGADVCREHECYRGARGDDGVACSIPNGVGHFYCQAGNCSPSRCGDGVFDSDSEECDDGNLVYADGCEPTCKYSCEEASDCDDSNVCNGDETCDTRAHTCAAGSNIMDGADCGMGRTCASGRCVASGCGDKETISGEDCDDGNQVSGDGCDDCKFSCVSDEQCNDGNACSGAESCDVTKHVCVPGVPTDCDDKDPCTANGCHPESGKCQSELIDADGDGHADEALGACGDDCDDQDPAVYTGAEELCDNRDNNCNGQKDETAPTHYVDCDGDGYAAAGAVSIKQCDVPPAPKSHCKPGQAGQWVNKAPAVGTTDCWDESPNVKPMTASEANSAWSLEPIAGQTSSVDYDYNCDEVEEKYPTFAGVKPGTCGYVLAPLAVLPGPIVKSCPGNYGYTVPTAPECGKSAQYTYCASDCTRIYENRRQSCR